MPTLRRYKRLRPAYMRSTSSVPVEYKKHSKFDVWLQRLSHLSQFGLFAFTVGTIYFTVIPLYQKSLLDEAIAKKELELTNANASLEKAYSRIRTFVVKGYVFSAGLSCSGLMLPPRSLPAAEKPESPRPSPEDEIIAIDVSKCLVLTAKNAAPLNELRTEDRKLLEQKILDVGNDIQPLRQRAIVALEDVPRRAKTDPSSLPKPDGFTARTLVLLAQREPPARYAQQVLEASIRAEQRRIAGAYTQEIRNRISSLANIAWERRN